MTLLCDLDKVTRLLNKENDTYLHFLGFWEELNMIMCVKCEIYSRCSVMVASICIY